MVRVTILAALALISLSVPSVSAYEHTAADQCDWSGRFVFYTGCLSLFAFRELSQVSAVTSGRWDPAAARDESFLKLCSSVLCSFYEKISLKNLLILLTALISFINLLKYYMK